MPLDISRNFTTHAIVSGGFDLFWPCCCVSWLLIFFFGGGGPLEKGTCLTLYFSINLHYLAWQTHVSIEFFICEGFYCLSIILCWSRPGFLFWEYYLGSVIMYQAKQGRILYSSLIESLWTCNEVEWLILYIFPIHMGSQNHFHVGKRKVTWETRQFGELHSEGSRGVI